MQPVHVYLGSATPSAAQTGASPPLRVDLSTPTA
jgi:hypothetical protein